MTCCSVLTWITVTFIHVRSALSPCPPGGTGTVVGIEQIVTGAPVVTGLGGALIVVHLTNWPSPASGTVAGIPVDLKKRYNSIKKPVQKNTHCERLAISANYHNDSP